MVVSGWAMTVVVGRSSKPDIVVIVLVVVLREAEATWS